MESPLKCLGTRSIELKRDDFDFSTPGMVAAFSSTNNVGDDDSSSLRIMVTDGTATYGTSIPIKDISTKGNWHSSSEGSNSTSSTSKTESLARCLLQSDGESSSLGDKKSSTTVSYELLSAENAVKLVLKETLPSELVISLWSGTLTKQPTQQEQDNESSSTMAFVLGNCVNQANLENQALKDQIANLTRDLRLAKQTVDKLDSAMQSEKDDLLQRFLVLYNISKENLRKANKKVQQLELKVERYKSTNSNNKNVVKARLPAFAMAADDFDEEPPPMETFDPDLVDRLAEGQTTISRDEEASPGTSSPMKPAVNPLTGAKELWGVKRKDTIKEIFEDDKPTSAAPSNNSNSKKKVQKEKNSSAPYAKKKSSSKRRKEVNQNLDYSSSDSNQFGSPVTKRQRKNPPANANDSGSDTTSDAKPSAAAAKKKKDPSAPPAKKKPNHDLDYSSSDSFDVGLAPKRQAKKAPKQQHQKNPPPPANDSGSDTDMEEGAKKPPAKKPQKAPPMEDDGYSSADSFVVDF